MKKVSLTKNEMLNLASVINTISESATDFEIMEMDGSIGSSKILYFKINNCSGEINITDYTNM